MAAEKTNTPKPNKSAFIRSQPTELSAADVVEKAKAENEPTIISKDAGGIPGGNCAHVPIHTVFSANSPTAACAKTKAGRPGQDG